MAEEIDTTEPANKIGILRRSSPTRKRIMDRQEVRIVCN